MYAGIRLVFAYQFGENRPACISFSKGFNIVYTDRTLYALINACGFGCVKAILYATAYACMVSLMAMGISSNESGMD
jgi:hypothetical protein